MAKMSIADFELAWRLQGCENEHKKKICRAAMVDGVMRKNLLPKMTLTRANNPKYTDHTGAKITSDDYISEPDLKKLCHDLYFQLNTPGVWWDDWTRPYEWKYDAKNRHVVTVNGAARSAIICAVFDALKDI